MQLCIGTHTAAKSEDTEKHGTVIQNLSSLGSFCRGSYDLMPSFDWSGGRF